MKFQDKATDIVDAWVRDNLIYLKDGGGAKGLFHVAHADLVTRIDKALTENNADATKLKRNAAKKKLANASE
jgi:hypothetical protein